MLDLEKLNTLLDDALASETSDSLNQWIERQLEAESAENIPCDVALGKLSRNGKSDVTVTDIPEIKIGLSEYISYDSVGISDVYDDQTAYDDFNLVA